MRRRILFLLAALCALAAAAPALAEPHLTRAQDKEISALVNRFIHDIVLRENLPDGWRISGPEMRGGITKKDWYAGHELPVQRLRVIGDEWSHAWYATYPASGPVQDEVGLSVSLRVGRGENAEVWDEEMVLVRRHGTWLVNALYTNAIFRLGHKKHGSCVTSDCKTTGLNDFVPASGTRGGGGGAPMLGMEWFWVIVGAVVGVPLTALLGWALYGRFRDRRAWAEYLATRRA